MSRRLQVAVGSVSASGKNCLSPPETAIHMQSFGLHSEQDRSPIRKNQIRYTQGLGYCIENH